MIRHSSYYNTSSDFVYLELRAKIVRKQLKPGERLPEIRISNEMGVSRTPVREALRRLASEGLVRIIPNSGARVTAPSAAEVDGAYNVREHLEALSVSLACKNGIDRRAAERLWSVLSHQVSTTYSGMNTTTRSRGEALRMPRTYSTIGRVISR